MAKDYPIKGPPSISLGNFQAVLVAAHSPAAGEAAGIYAAALNRGVDPALLLAIMQHESSFGSKGIAVGRHNLYGSRWYPGAAAFGAVNRGGWASFPSYAASTAYTAALLAGPSYAGAGLTARTFPTRYAPASDGNDPYAYGNAIVNAINKLRGEPVVAFQPSKAKAAGKPKAKRTGTVKRVAGKLVTPAPAGVNLWAIGTVALAAILLLILVI